MIGTRSGPLGQMRLTRLALTTALLVAALSAAPGARAQPAASTPPEPVTLTFYEYSEDAMVAAAEGLAADFMALNPHVTIDVETRPGGTEGDNLVKTRLATGDMTDLFQYTSGSLLQALSPEKTLVPLTNEPFVANISDAFIPAVSAGGDVFGVPIGSAVGGGILYNKPIYEQLGLEVPTTWDQFMANNQAILDSGLAAPVIQTYGDTWTSQVIFLADYHNVAAAEPDFADRYTGNQAKFATSPAGLRSFQRLQEVHDAGFLNEDFASATYADGVRMVATGEGAHYPMLTWAVAEIAATYPDNLDDVGLFALPGEDAAMNGLTVWTPNGVYIPTTTEGANLDAAKAFLAFIASPEGCASQTAAAAPTGPYLVQGCDLPTDLPPAVQDMLPYLESGAATPALEFLSPIKGPALEQITVEVGSGIRSAEDGAALYDEDVEKQAQQLGLPGW
jgi:raffinose/stachyose/melibiose transport system substrate-binding protein